MFNGAVHGLLPLTWNSPGMPRLPVHGIVGLYIKHDHLVVTREVVDVDDSVHSGRIWLATIQGMSEVAETSEGLQMNLRMHVYIVEWTIK